MSETPAIYRKDPPDMDTGINGDPEAVDMYMERNELVIEYLPDPHDPDDPYPWKVHDEEWSWHRFFPTREAAILGAWDHTYQQLEDLQRKQSELRRAWREMVG